MVPSCLIMKPPYPESTAPFFSNASGLRFSLSSNFPGAILRGSLMGKTLLCAPVSTASFLAELSEVLQRLLRAGRVSSSTCLS